MVTVHFKHIQTVLSNCDQDEDKINISNSSPLTLKTQTSRYRSAEDRLTFNIGMSRFTESYYDFITENVCETFYTLRNS